MERLTKRDFLKVSAATILLTCTGEFTSKDQKNPEKNNGRPQMGDVIVSGENSYLLRDSRFYPIPDLERYKTNTKFGKYGRKSWSLDTGSFPQLPVRELQATSNVFDSFSGQFKRGRPLGGEINVYFPGFMTDKGIPYDIIRPEEDTFVDIREKLKERNWQLFDSIFFTYGKRAINKFSEYQASDTSKSVGANIEHALEFMRYLKEIFPLAQFNLIAHSLGGIFALEVARKHGDAINNLILINSPVRGIDGNPVRRVQAQAAKLALKAYLGDEEVSDYLFDIWGKEGYQKDLVEFGESFTQTGRGLTIVTAEDDPFVPTESTVIKGADIVSIKVGSVPIINSLVAHGRPLKDEHVVKAIAEKIGENLSAT